MSFLNGYIYLYFVRYYKSPFYRYILSKAINFFTKPSRYSHVGVIIDDYPVIPYLVESKIKMERYNEIFVIESIAKAGGVTFTTINQNNRCSCIDLYKLRIVESDKVLINKEFMKEVGKKYDYRAFFSFVFDFLKQVPSRWYCSELIARKLQNYGFFIFKDYDKISPNDLYQILSKNYQLEFVTTFNIN